jgi:hypothetical protein
MLITSGCVRICREIRYVYFPIDGVASLVLEIGNSGVEVGSRSPVALGRRVAQSAACAHLHKVEQRCCRWLLMTRDRMPTDEFLLTQEFLGMMLGVTRPSVSLSMTGLQKAGLLRYSRGRVTILDRKRLQKRACECYKTSKLEFDRLLGDSPTEPRNDKTHRLVAEIG